MHHAVQCRPHHQYQWQANSPPKLPHGTHWPTGASVTVTVCTSLLHAAITRALQRFEWCSCRAWQQQQQAMSEACAAPIMQCSAAHGARGKLMPPHTASRHALTNGCKRLHGTAACSYHRPSSTALQERSRTLVPRSPSAAVSLRARTPTGTRPTSRISPLLAA